HFIPSHDPPPPLIYPLSLHDALPICIPRKGECDYSTVLELDLAAIVPSVAGPKRPQDRIALPDLKDQFLKLLEKPVKDGGYGKTVEEIAVRYPADIGASEHGLAMIAGGGQQLSAGAPAPTGNHVTDKDTSVWSETEMMNNRSTPDRVVEVLPEEFPRAHVDL